MIAPRILSFVFAILAITQTINADAPANFTSRLDRFAKCMMNYGSPQFAVPQLTVSVVGLGNQTWFTKGYGTLFNQATNQTRPVDEYTLFGIGSVTKAFTSALLVKSLPFADLDQPINDLGFNLKTYSDFLNGYGTLIDLMSHRTGIMRADLLWLTQTPFNQSVSWQHTVASTFPYLPAHVTPRNHWLYNNYAYGQVGSYVEMLAGTSYESALASMLLEPLNMTSTVFGHRAARLKTDNIANLFSPSTLKTELPIMLPTELDDIIDAIAPAGAINTNAVDMAEWMKAQLGARPDVLTSDDLAVLHEVEMIELGADISNLYITNTNPSISQIYSGYALGWMKYALNGRLLLTHQGSTLGQISLITLFPNEQFGVFTSSPAVSMDIHNLISLWVFYEVAYGSENNFIDKRCESEAGELTHDELNNIQQAVNNFNRVFQRYQSVSKHQPVAITSQSIRKAIQQSNIANQFNPSIEQFISQDWPASTFVGLYSDSLWGTVNISLFNDTRYPGADLLMTYGSLQMAMTPHASPEVNAIFDCATLQDSPLRFLVPGSASFLGFEINPASGRPSALAVALEYKPIIFLPFSGDSSSTGMSSPSSSSTGDSSSTGMSSPSSSSTGSADNTNDDTVSLKVFAIVTAVLSVVLVFFCCMSIFFYRGMRKARFGDMGSWDQSTPRSNLL